MLFAAPITSSQPVALAHWPTDSGGVESWARRFDMKASRSAAELRFDMCEGTPFIGRGSVFLRGDAQARSMACVRTVFVGQVGHRHSFVAIALASSKSGPGGVSAYCGCVVRRAMIASCVPNARAPLGQVALDDGDPSMRGCMCGGRPALVVGVVLHGVLCCHVHWECCQTAEVR